VSAWEAAAYLVIILIILAVLFWFAGRMDRN
jgi:hypothetical protein